MGLKNAFVLEGRLIIITRIETLVRKEISAEFRTEADVAP